MKLWFSATGQRTVQNCDSPQPPAKGQQVMWALWLHQFNSHRQVQGCSKGEGMGTAGSHSERRRQRLELREAEAARAPGSMLEGQGCTDSAPRTCRGDAFVFGWRLTWMNSWEHELKLHEDRQKRTERSKVRNSWSCIGQKVSARGETS